MLELTVKTLDSQNHSFTLTDEATVLNLKESILEKMDVPVASQRLIFHGKVLQDSKKLTEYGDVNGKVIHLVQRAPPSSSGQNDSPASRVEGNGTTTGRRLPRSREGNTAYLSSMAFPTDFLDGGFEMPSRPSQAMARNRIDCAKRMMGFARTTLSGLENVGSQPPTPRLGRRPRRGPTGPSVSVAPTEDRGTSTSPAPASQNAPIHDAQESITQAARDATAAAIAAAISSPSLTIVTQSIGQPSRPQETNENFGDLQQEVAIEVEIESSSDSSTESRSESEQSVQDNSAPEPPPPNRREDGARAEHMAPLLQELETLHGQLQPYLTRAREILSADPSFDGLNPPYAYHECVRVFNGVSETLHNLAHASHALSDLMVDFEEDAPRSLRCRPVVLQHSTILETGYPIRLNQPDFEAQINVRRVDIGGNAAGPVPPTPPDASATMTPTASTTATATAANSRATTTTTATAPSVGTASASTSTSATGGDPITATGPRTGPIPATGGADGGDLGLRVQIEPQGLPTNLEIFMDFGPEGLTVESVETVLRNRENRNNAGNTNNAPNDMPPPVPGEPFSANNPPLAPNELRAFVALPTVLQSVETFAGQLQNHLMSRLSASLPNAGNQRITVSPIGSVIGVGMPSNRDAAAPNSRDQAPNNVAGQTPARPPNTATSSSATSESSPTVPPAGAGNAVPAPPPMPTGPNAGGTRSTFIPVRRTIPMTTVHSLLQGAFDPLLPCNSHHIRSTRQRSVQTRAARSEAVNDSRHSEGTSQPQQQPRPPQRVRRRSSPGHRRFLGWSSLPRLPPWLEQEFASRPVPRSVHEFLNRVFPLRGSQPEGFPSASVSVVPMLSEQLPMSTTLAQFFDSVSAAPQTEGSSIVRDFFLTLARNLTWEDVIELSMSRQVETILSRLRPVLREFASQRLLQGEAPTQEAIKRACERVFLEIIPYIDVMHLTELRESVDLYATINNYNQVQLPEFIDLIMDSGTNSNFAINLTRKLARYIRQLVAIVMHCCEDRNQGFDSLIRNCLRSITEGFPADLQEWTELHSVNHIRLYVSSLNVPLEDIQRYLVYRIPEAAATAIAATPSQQEPMETDAAQSDPLWVAPEAIPSPEKVEEPIAEALVAMDTENLPEVLIGSEAWHATLPQEWVPVIARDSQRQRRQSAQKPLSDAYLTGMPPKRRKIITAAKPQNDSLPQTIADGVRQAIQAAGVNSPIADRVAIEAGRNAVLQQAHKEQERATGSALLRSDPEFKPARFPNACKYFDK